MSSCGGLPIVCGDIFWKLDAGGEGGGRDAKVCLIERQHEPEVGIGLGVGWSPASYSEAGG